MKRKFMALALAAAMTVSMTSAVFAADEIKSADDLTGKKIGVQLGTTGDTIATDIKDATVERYNKGNDAVMALKQGKIDCVVSTASRPRSSLIRMMTLSLSITYLIKRSMRSVFPRTTQILPKNSTTH